MCELNGVLGGVEKKGRVSRKKKRKSKKKNVDFVSMWVKKKIFFYLFRLFKKVFMEKYTQPNKLFERKKKLTKPHILSLLLLLR